MRLANLIAQVMVMMLFLTAANGQDRVFSGPQPGEKTSPFRVFDVTGPSAGKEIDYVTSFAGAPTVMVFVHGIERSMLPLVNVVDQYAAERKDKIKPLFVFLTADRVALEQRLPLIKQSVRWSAPLTISLDGAEGPGNYGLNKQCLLTIVVAKENRVTANFALVQPGIADAPKVIEAMAKAMGDASPPTTEELQSRRQGQAPNRAEGRPARPGAMREAAPFDPSKFDLKTNEGLRAAVEALLAEVIALRREVASLRAGGAQPARPAENRRAAETLPGAAPTDERLIGMLRSFIQLSNDNAAVDGVIKQVEDYVRGSADLTKQAVDGWVRVLHLKYGTEYARTAGQSMVDRLKK